MHLSILKCYAEEMAPRVVRVIVLRVRGMSSQPQAQARACFLHFCPSEPELLFFASRHDDTMMELNAIHPRGTAVPHL